MNHTNCRIFLKTPLTTATGAMLVSPALVSITAQKRPYQISLAQWSYHKILFAKEMTNLDFPVMAKKMGVYGVAYAKQFFKDKTKHESYLANLGTFAKRNAAKQII